MSSEEFWGPLRILWDARCVLCVVGTHTCRGAGGQQLRLYSEATVHTALRSLIEDAQGSRAVPKSERVSTFAFYSCDKHMTKSILEKKGRLNRTSRVTAHDKSPGRSSKPEPRGRNCGSQVHQLSPMACSARSLFSYTPTTTFLGTIPHGIALPTPVVNQGNIPEICPQES